MDNSIVDKNMCYEHVTVQTKLVVAFVRYSLTNETVTYDISSFQNNVNVLLGSSFSHSRFKYVFLLVYFNILGFISGFAFCKTVMSLGY